MRYTAVPTPAARALQAGEPDAYGRRPERAVSDGSGNPCRHCLTEIPAGETMLIAAFRPFTTCQPYAETGPIFLCAGRCERHPASTTLPAMFSGWPALLARGYTKEERIVCGTGGVVGIDALAAWLETLFARPSVDFVHLRSASNNCFQCRVERD